MLPYTNCNMPGFWKPEFGGTKFYPSFTALQKSGNCLRESVEPGSHPKFSVSCAPGVLLSLRAHHKSTESRPLDQILWHSIPNTLLKSHMMLRNTDAPFRTTIGLVLIIYMPFLFFEIGPD